MDATNQNKKFSHTSKLEIKAVEVVIQLQEELGLSMWLAQSPETQEKASVNDFSRYKFSVCLVSIWKGVPLMNIVPYLRGGDCYYTLNLKTGRPTARSQSQIRISKELLALIRSHAHAHGFFG